MTGYIVSILYSTLYYSYIDFLTPSFPHLKLHHYRASSTSDPLTAAPIHNQMMFISYKTHTTGCSYQTKRVLVHSDHSFDLVASDSSPALGTLGRFMEWITGSTARSKAATPALCIALLEAGSIMNEHVVAVYTAMNPESFMIGYVDDGYCQRW